MALFDTRYYFMYDKKRSRGYLTAGRAVRAGARRVKGPSWLKYRSIIVGSGAVGQLREFRQARSLTTARLNRRPVGDTIRMEAVREDGTVVNTVRFRKAKVLPRVKNTPGNLYLDRVEGYIEAAFPYARWAGDCVCKPDSDHRWCRAVDYFDQSVRMDAMRRHLLAYADYFGIEYIILFDRIWHASGSSAHYSGTYHSHIHVSVRGQSYSAC